MDTIFEKLRKSRTSTMILGFLSISWIIVDYFVLGKLFESGNITLGFELILLILSAVAIIAFHISVFVTLFYTYKVTHKYKKESKSQESEIDSKNKKSEENATKG